MPVARIRNHRIHYRVWGDYAVVRPEGPCNQSEIEALASFVSSSLVEYKNLVVDFSHSRYVETPGFRWIVRQFRQLESSGKTLVVAGLPPSMERSFKLLRLNETVPVTKNVPEALAMLYPRSADRRWLAAVADCR